MEKKNAGYRLFTFYLDNAQDNKLFASAGEILQIVDASSPSATMSVRINDEDGPLVRLRLGDIVALPFQRFWITSSAQTSQWVKVLVSPDIQNRFYFSDYVTSFDGRPRLVSDVSVTSSLTAVISPTKECSKFVLANDPDGNYAIYIGDDTLDPSGGVLGDFIIPTERREFHGVNSSFKIYARCKTGESGTLGVIEYD